MGLLDVLSEIFKIQRSSELHVLLVQITFKVEKLYALLFLVLYLLSLSYIFTVFRIHDKMKIHHNF